MKDALLSVQEIHTYYGESHILQGVSLDVQPGGVVSLMGRNGAGKTTTLRSIMRLTPPRRGTVKFAGRSLEDRKTYQIAQAGIALVPETRGVFPSLTVRENLSVAARGGEPNGAREAWTVDRIYDLFPRLAERRDNGGAQLSGGEQQMLAIARALLTNPTVLLLDEPGEGLAPIIVQEIYKTLNSLKAAGTTMLLVEKNFAFATSLADRVYVIGKGRIRWSGSGADLRREDEVKHTWLGV